MTTDVNWSPSAEDLLVAKGQIENLERENYRLRAQLERIKGCHTCKTFVNGEWRNNPKCDHKVCYTGHRSNWEEAI